MRLGLIYSAVGIIVSFVVLTIGLLLSILFLVFMPFLEDSKFSFLTLIPFGLCLLVLHRYLHRISMKITEEQWAKMNEEMMLNTSLPLEAGSLYLAGNKWTDLWFYVTLYVTIELLPIILRTIDLETSITAILLFAVFMSQLSGIYRTQKRSRIDSIKKST